MVAYFILIVYRMKINIIKKPIYSILELHSYLIKTNILKVEIMSFSKKFKNLYTKILNVTRKSLRRRVSHLRIIDLI